MDTIKNWTLIQWISLLVGLNTFLLGATTQLTVLFGPTAVTYIMTVITLANGALGVFGMMFGGQGSQIRNVAAMPGIEPLKVNAQANQTLAQIALDNTVAKVEVLPAAKAAVTATANAT